MNRVSDVALSQYSKKNEIAWVKPILLDLQEIRAALAEKDREIERLADIVKAQCNNTDEYERHLETATDRADRAEAALAATRGITAEIIEAGADALATMDGEDFALAAEACFGAMMRRSAAIAAFLGQEEQTNEKGGGAPCMNLDQVRDPAPQSHDQACGAESGWRPIAEAPVNQAIVVRHPGKDGEWVATMMHVCVDPEDADHGSWWNVLHYNGDTLVSNFHPSLKATWQPLPAPPAPKEPVR